MKPTFEKFRIVPDSLWTGSKAVRGEAIRVYCYLIYFYRPSAPAVSRGIMNISERLGISPTTVRSSIKSLIEKGHILDVGKGGRYSRGRYMFTFTGKRHGKEVGA